MSEIDSPSWWFAFRGSELLVRVEGSEARILRNDEWESLGLPAGAPHAVGSFQGAGAWAVEVPEGMEPPEGMVFHGLRRLWGLLEEEAWRLAGRAVQIVDWDRNHRFCGRCGAETEPKTGEWARVCPRCGLQHFPRLSPAVIVRIERGDEILLARSPHFPPGVYSTLAGFVEPGESLEQTVVREVEEEVGVRVTKVRYFGSQPWPFPNSLMIGFVAEYESGEIIPEPGEIEDAGWFTVETLPKVPPKLSIARALIDQFVEARRKG
ncbi:MAG TPA: NAD(+) diphosphatase [Thermoanaerobaculia bacterium]|nr:NAD(+) diphosphatase [Thermoanaerobaculia bacterium]